MTGPILKLENVAKRFGRREVLRGRDPAVQRKEREAARADQHILVILGQVVAPIPKWFHENFQQRDA